MGAEVVNLKRSLSGLNHAAARYSGPARPEQQKRVSKILDDARRQIYGVLAEED